MKHKIICPNCGRAYFMDVKVFEAVSDICQDWNFCDPCLDDKSQRFNIMMKERGLHGKIN